MALSASKSSALEPEEPPSNASVTATSRKLGQVMTKAAKAVRDGYAASLSSIVSVLLLMWLRTTVAYQYVHGVSMMEAITALYEEGGIPRFYRGLFYALLIMPLSRFGDIASNEVAREFYGETLSSTVVTAIASTLAATWRVLISPVDTAKTLMQVHGNQAVSLLTNKVATSGIGVMWEGAVGAAVATWVGYYPWFLTHNFLEALCVRHQILDAHLPQSKGARRHVRRALVGLCSSLVSDLSSNAIRVLKVYKQSNPVSISYFEAFTRVVAESGFRGLFLRGLSGKLVSNAINAMLFTVLWKLIADKLEANRKKEALHKNE